MKDPFGNNQKPIEEKESLQGDFREAKRRVEKTAKKSRPETPDDRTGRAKAMVREEAVPIPENLEALSPTEARRLVHALRVHQIDLETQNEELRREKLKLEDSLVRYVDLYDLAPVGYFTLSAKGLIREANSTAATLLGVARGALAEKPFASFILDEDQEFYNRYRAQLFETPSASPGQAREPQACELRMLKQEGTPFWAYLEASAAQDPDGTPVLRIVMRDITERKFQEDERDLTMRLLTLVNRQDDFSETMSALTASLQAWSGCEAVGIRLRTGEDYPYYETRGFPPDFVQEESRLCAYDPDGQILRDGAGNPLLECMCGNILSGRFDPGKPFFTTQGSFWSNNTTALLAGTAERDRQGHTRNRCNGAGYESVALIPLRTGDQVFGLLQFNDHRPDRFSPRLVAHLERMADGLALALWRRQAGEALQLAHDELEQRVASRTEELRQVNEELRTDISGRMRAEEELRDSEANLHLIAEQLEDVLFATDPSGFITFASPSALQMFGWKPEEIVGSNFVEFLPEAEIPCAVKQFKESLVSGGKTHNLSFAMKRRDEGTFPCELNCSVISKEGCPAGMVGIVRDITERRRAEEALKESEERYRNQIEAINDVAYALNSSGEVTYISPVVKTLLGYEPDEITGRPFLAFVHPEDQELTKGRFTELREGIVSHGEYRVISKSGDVKWVRSQTRPILDIEGFTGGRGILVDISEHKRAEGALRRAEENFRRSLEESPLGVRIVTIDGKTIYANRMILDIYGYDTIEALERVPLKDRYTPQSYAEFLDRREKRRQGIPVPSEYTIDIVRKSGDVGHLRVFRKEILWDNETQYQVIYQDITEHRQAKEALAAKSLQLEESHTALRDLLQSVKEEKQEGELSPS
jgi:PAS domain S-box-containing protein